MPIYVDHRFFKDGGENVFENHFITTKNRFGSDDYNNFNPDEWDIPTCKKLFIKLLEWIHNNNSIINIANNNNLTKIFQTLLNRELRQHKLIGSVRKSILINILNKILIV